MGGSSPFEKGEIFLITKLIPTRQVCTRLINEKLDKSMKAICELGEIIERFCSCDFGDLCEEDTHYQKYLLETDNKDMERLMGVYKFLGEKVWVMYEYYSSFDRVLTVLYPDEY